MPVRANEPPGPADGKLVRHPFRNSNNPPLSLSTPRTIAHVDNRHNHLLQPQIKHIALAQLRLEIRTPSQHQPGHVGPIVRDEVLHGNLGHLPHVVMPLLHPQPRKPQRTLPSPPVLLRQIHRELMQHLAMIPGQRPVQAPVPVHHDKPVLLVRLHQLRQRFRVKLVIAQVQRRVDRLERLKVNVHFPLLPLVRDHRPGVHDEPVRGHFRVQLETLLGRGDGPQDRLSVHPGFNVRGRPVLGLEHRLGLADLRLWRQDEADHGRPVAFCLVQHFDKLCVVVQGVEGER